MSTFPTSTSAAATLPLSYSSSPFRNLASPSLPPLTPPWRHHHKHRIRASNPRDPDWGPSTSHRSSATAGATRRGRDICVAVSSSSSVSARTTQRPSFPTSAVLSALSSDRLDEALELVVRFAVDAGDEEALREETWGDLIQRRRRRPVDDIDNDVPPTPPSSSSAPSDAASALVSSLCAARRTSDALLALRCASTPFDRRQGSSPSPPPAPRRYSTYQDLISACCAAGDARRALAAYRLLQSAPSSSSPLSGGGVGAGVGVGDPSPLLQPNLVTTCGVISALSREAKSARKGTASYSGGEGGRDSFQTSPAAAAAHSLWKELLEESAEPPSPSDAGDHGGAGGGAPSLPGNLDAEAVVVGMNACVGVGAVEEARELLRQVTEAASKEDEAEAASSGGGGDVAAGDGRARPRPLAPTAPMFNILLKAASRDRDAALLRSTLEDMRRCGVSPTRVTSNTLVSGFARAGDLDAARAAALEELPPPSLDGDGAGDGARSGLAVDGEGEGGEEGGGPRPRRRRYDGPDVWALAALAAGYVAAGRRSDAEELYPVALASIRASASGSAYPSDPAARGGGGSPDESDGGDAASVGGDGARGSGDGGGFSPPPSSSPASSAVVFFTTLVDGAARDGDAAAAQRWFDVLVDVAGPLGAGPPNATTFNALLRAYCTGPKRDVGDGAGGGVGVVVGGGRVGGVETAEATTTATSSPAAPLPRDPHRPTPDPLSNVDPLSGALVGALRGADAAAAAVGGDGGLLAGATTTEGEVAPPPVPLTPPPPPAQQAPASSMEGVLRTLALMGRHGVRPRVDTYNALMAACLSRGHPAAVPRLFRALLLRRSSSPSTAEAPDALSWTTLIAALARLGRADDAARAFGELEAAAAAGECAPPDAAAAAALVDALCRVGGSGSRNEGSRTSGGILFSTSSPSTSSSSSESLSAARRRALYLADDLSRARGGASPPSSAWGAAVAGACRAGDLDEAVGLLAEFVSKGGEPDGGMLDAVATACVSLSSPSSSSRNVWKGRGEDASEGRGGADDDVARAIEALRGAEAKVSLGAEAKWAMKRALAALIGRQQRQQQEREQRQEQQEQQQRLSRNGSAKRAAEGIERLKFWLGLPNRYYGDGYGSDGGSVVGSRRSPSGGAAMAAAAATASPNVAPTEQQLQQLPASPSASRSPVLKRRSGSSFGGGGSSGRGAAAAAASSSSTRPRRRPPPPSTCSPASAEPPWGDGEEDSLS